MLLYWLLHLSGYDLPLDEINFRQWGSRTPGHPERGHTPGVETTTGPLGQGVRQRGRDGDGRALPGRALQPAGPPVVDHRIWAFASDGDLMEGVASEAASLAGHLRLGKLTLIYDDNHITIDGDTALTFTEDVQRRFEGYGWRVLHVADGNDLDAITRGARAARAESDRPTLIVLRTFIADPAPTKRNTAEAHGAPLGADEVRRTKEILGWPEDPTFFVPEDALAHWRTALDRGAAHERSGRSGWSATRGRIPTLAARVPALAVGGAARGMGPRAARAAAERRPLATRQASGLGAPGDRRRGAEPGRAGPPTWRQHRHDAEAGRQRSGPTSSGRAVHWGVREHGMGACLNGIAAHGGLRPFGSTFLVFSDYMKPAIRLAAIMRLPVIYIGTHDSIGLGEDGPTHQPIEHLAMLRAIPDLVVLRPATPTRRSRRGGWRWSGTTARPRWC